MSELSWFNFSLMFLLIFSVLLFLNFFIFNKSLKKAFKLNSYFNFTFLL